MKIRVAAPDAASAAQLAQQLVGIGDRAAVRIDGAWTEVRVRPGAQTDGIIVRVLRTVENWLDDEGVDLAEVHLDDRSHVMARNGFATGGPEWS